jgi:hypothetical protein
MDNNQIYYLIKENIFKFKNNNNEKKSIEKLISFLNSRNINIQSNFSTFIELFDYLRESQGKYCGCGNENKFIRFTEGYSKFCSYECLYKWRSINMLGENNNVHKMTDDSKKAMGLKNSLHIKSKIANGTFTPNVTNSWARSKCIVKIKRCDITLNVACRSSWDAYFQLKNPECLYEKIRIPYFYKNNYRSYIVDFVNIQNRVLYEIKPSTHKNNELNTVKINAAKKWALENNYEFKIIDESWFNSNYDKNILKNQPDEMRMLRLLKQFE